eukprot:scaffold2006_cov283-Chaetoceros_neogracile.AAC.7
MESSSIPVMRSPNDIMTYGPNGDNLAAAAIQSHPVDRMQRAIQFQTRNLTYEYYFTTNSSFHVLPTPTATTPTTSLDLDSIRRLYGSALAMRIHTYYE